MLLVPPVEGQGLRYTQATVLTGNPADFRSWWIIGRLALPGVDSPDLVVRGLSIIVDGGLLVIEGGGAQVVLDGGSVLIEDGGTVRTEDAAEDRFAEMTAGEYQLGCAVAAVRDAGAYPVADQPEQQQSGRAGGADIQSDSGDQVSLQSGGIAGTSVVVTQGNSSVL